MSQSRFSIVLVGVSALFRRPLVSRLRPAGFTARGSGGFRRSGRPSASGLPLGELVLPPSASGLPLGGLVFGLTASAFRHAPLRGCHSAGWRFRSASWFFCLPFRRLPLGRLAFGLTASAFRHAPLRSCLRRVGSSAFRFGDCRSAGWASGSRFGVALGELAFGLTASAFRHAPLRSCPRRVGLRAHCFRFSARPASEITARRVGLRAHDFRFSACTASGLPSASWPSGSRLLLFGMRRSAPPYRRSEGRRNTPTRHLFHFKTLIPTC